MRLVIKHGVLFLTEIAIFINISTPEAHSLKEHWLLRGALDMAPERLNG